MTILTNHSKKVFISCQFMINVGKCANIKAYTPPEAPAKNSFGSVNVVANAPVSTPAK
eukprot:02208.XXX_51528_51701_1 [CDS] Oithona nana genome sequencing.